MNSRPLRRLLRFRLAGVERLHVGCGGIWVPGWLNMDRFPVGLQPYGALRRREGALVLSFDASGELPLHEGRLWHVYGSHFIEHLSFAEALAFLAECHRALRPGGLIRLTCPDLELWARRYLERDEVFLRSYEQATARTRDLPELRTGAQVLMSQLHGWGHRWAYDEESLCEALERSGFDEARRRGHRESRLPDIDLLEPATPSRLLETLYVEAVRP
jgi:predicted SAM-dependent methyltransferase